MPGHAHRNAAPAALISVISWLLAALAPDARAGDPATPSVTVTGKRAAVVRKVDRTVHDVSNMPRAANGTAQDVLQSTPGVSVTADGQISVEGNTRVTVLVDGKPAAALSGEERAVALQTMSGTDIASVEVITSPSAAYAGNGGAVVNIVLKRNRKPGAHAQVRGSASGDSLWNAGVSGDVTRNNLAVQGSLAYRHDGTRKVRRSEVEWNNPAGGEAAHTLQASDVFIRRVVASATLGIDVSLSNTDSLSLAARYNDRRSRPLFDVLNMARSGAGETIYHRISYGPNEQSDDSASLGYSHQGGDMAFKATVQRSSTVGLVDKSYRDVFVEPVRATAYGHGATRSARHLDQATLDWTRRSAYGQWGMGVDLQDEANDLANYQASADPSTGAETPDPGTTNHYAVATTLAAAYATGQVRHGQWEGLLGGRIERVALRVRGEQATVPAVHWRAFNPSLHLKYAVTDKARFTLGYRRSLQRPDPRDLNPYATYVDAQNLSRGNPGLGPQSVSAWEFGTEVETARLSGSLGAFHRVSRDTVVDARSYTGNVLVTSKRNGGRARSAGMTGSLDWTPDPKLRLGIDGSIWHAMLSTPDLDVPVRQEGVSGYLKWRAAYRSGGDDVSLDAQVQAAGITPLGRYGTTSSVNLAWRHAVSKALSLTVNANDVFDGSRRAYRTDAGTFRQAGFDHFVARRVYVGVVGRIE